MDLGPKITATCLPEEASNPINRHLRFTHRISNSCIHPRVRQIPAPLPLPYTPMKGGIVLFLAPLGASAFSPIDRKVVVSKADTSLGATLAPQPKEHSQDMAPSIYGSIRSLSTVEASSALEPSDDSAAFDPDLIPAWWCLAAGIGMSLGFEIIGKRM